MNPHAKVLFLRKKHIIYDASNGAIVFEGTDFEGNASINAAKRKSRALQDENHRFCVKVVERLLPIGDQL